MFSSPPTNTFLNPLITFSRPPPINEASAGGPSAPINLFPDPPTSADSSPVTLLSIPPTKTTPVPTAVIFLPPTVVTNGPELTIVPVPPSSRLVFVGLKLK